MSLIKTKIREWLFDDKLEAKNTRDINANAGLPAYQNVFSVSFNGEKNIGEIGAVKKYVLDYDTMRIRSWQSYLESEITQTVLNRFKIWIIAGGLKLQSNPTKAVLKSEKIDLDTEVFNEVTEARFTAWSKSTACDFSQMNNLAGIAQEAFKNAKIGGDVLVVLRVVNETLKIQLIDGEHIKSPNIFNEFFNEKLANGNYIKDGIELDTQGRHIAYHVAKVDGGFERIEAISKATGLTTSFLVYGLKFRLNNYRGVPLIITVLETLSKLDRYKEATVATAEEIAKIAYQILHDPSSTGENPLAAQLAKAMDVSGSGDLPKDRNGKDLSDQVAATTNKQAINMPIGAEVKPMNNGNGQLQFKDFYSTNVEIVCAAIGIPPNVAMSMYNDSFSASRAATKDWEHTINVSRDEFSFQFYQKIYEFWLHLEILKNKINAPGYLQAFYQGNETLLSAYRNARFTGPLFPHIDPLKEARAEREKLGELGKFIPLTTIEQATEVLNGGDSDSNIHQFSEEYKYAKELGLILEDENQ